MELTVSDLLRISCPRTVMSLSRNGEITTYLALYLDCCIFLFVGLGSDDRGNKTLIKKLTTPSYSTTYLS
jgi:hypothetical protein